MVAIVNLPVSLTLSKKVVAICSRMEVSNFAGSLMVGDPFLVCFFRSDEARLFCSSAKLTF